MRLVILRSWRRLRPGQEIERDDGVANVLIRRHIARPAKLIETAAVCPPETTAAVRPRSSARRKR